MFHSGIKKILLSLAMVATLITSTVSCNHQNGFDIKKSDIGSITGAIGGAWLGSNVGKGRGKYAAIAAGTLLGAALGNSIGSSLDRADMAYYNKVSQSTLENTRTGEQITWQNPDTGTSGSITPVRTYQQASTNQYCREYQQTITVGGQTENGYGTACRQPDGSWKIVQ